LLKTELLMLSSSTSDGMSRCDTDTKG
jgi:hypothetical protein